DLLHVHPGLLYLDGCYPIASYYSSDGLEVKIPEQSPLRVVLGSSLNIPCYFNIPEEQETSALLTPRIKWSKLSNGTEVVLLVATGGKIRLNTEYREAISLPNYPAIPTDATLEIKALRSNHTGIYRCEVMYGIEDRQDTIEVLCSGRWVSSHCSFRYCLLMYHDFVAAPWESSRCPR
uniref:Ig-like domain-containing protein n=1 Tax=Bubo bubo TaxID=30461 RepID=A0A8C0EHN1_BUBBB